MVAPSYITDLTTSATGDINVDTGTWDESSDAGWDTGGAMVDDQNLYYNNTECVSAQMTKDSNGTGATGPATIMYVHGSSFTIPADGAALIHHLWAAPPALNTIANGGIKILLGNGLGVFNAYNISGSDFIPAPKGGWANYAINPAAVTADDVVGGGGTSPYTTVGMGVGALQQARGNPNACNAVRHGRCEAIFTGGEVANYATFTGFSVQDAVSTNKWSLLDPVEGGIKWQGLMSIGTAGTVVDFRDANVNVNIANTIAVSAAFNRIEVNNAGSNVEWTAIQVSALGTVSKGQFEVIDNATVAKTNCSFTDMDTFIYLSNTTLTNTTFRRCSTITQGGATISGCTFDESSNAINLISTDSTFNLVTGNTFNSNGTGHAVNLGTVTATTTVSWNNTDTGYAGTNGATGNETILVSVDSGQTLTINVAGGTTPTYYNTGLGTVTVIAGATLTINNLVANTEIRIHRSSDGAALDGIEDAITADPDNAGRFKFDYAYTVNQAIYIQVINLQYEILKVNYTLDGTDQKLQVSQRYDRNYDNPI